MEFNGCFYCGKHSLLSGSLWKMFFPSAMVDLSESLCNGNASSISLHLARQPPSQCVHCCLFIVCFFFSCARNISICTLQSKEKDTLFFFSLKTVIFLVLFLLSVNRSSSVEQLLVQWWTEHMLVFQAVLISWELKTFFPSFQSVSTSLYSPQMLHIFVFCACFFWCELYYSQVKKVLKKTKQWSGREGLWAVRNSRSRTEYMVMVDAGKVFKNIWNWPVCPHTEVKDKPVLCALETPTCKTLHLRRGKHRLKREDFKWTPRGQYDDPVLRINVSCQKRIHLVLQTWFHF